MDAFFVFASSQELLEFRDHSPPPEIFGRFIDAIQSDFPECSLSSFATICSNPDVTHNMYRHRVSVPVCLSKHTATEQQDKLSRTRVIENALLSGGDYIASIKYLQLILDWATKMERSNVVFTLIVGPS